MNSKKCVTENKHYVAIGCVLLRQGDGGGVHKLTAYKTKLVDTGEHIFDTLL